MKTTDLRVAEVGEWLGAGTLNFFGKPTAGKDTNAERLNPHLGGVILGGGDILRNSSMPDELRAEMNSGALIPSEQFRDIVMPFLGQESFAGKPLLLSSVGRVKGEEDGVLLATEAAGHPIMAVPHLAISNDEAFRRLKEMPDRGRVDDSPEKLVTRLDEYLAKTEPVLQVYEQMGLLVTIDAMAEKDIVFSTMINLLHERALAS